MSKSVIILLLAVLTGFPALAQVDSLQHETDHEVKKQRKRTSDFKVYAGVTLSQIIESGPEYETASSIGYNLGAAFRKGRFVYWEIGTRFNGSLVALEAPAQNLEETVGIQLVEVPVSVGLNLLSAVRRVVGLRIYGGVAPGFIIGVSDNDLDISKDDFNTTQFSWQLGAGVDIAFFFIEVGYNRGFTDMFEIIDSRLSQGYLNIGFRF